MNDVMKKESAIVFIGHGSRDPASNQQMEEFVASYSLIHPEYDVSFGYIEISRPFMLDALRVASERCENVIAVPLLFFKSGHAKNDIAALIGEIKKEFSRTQFYICDVLGVHPLLSELAYMRAEKTGAFGNNHRSIAALFIGRGSSDPDANANLYRQSRLFEEGRNFSRVLTCFEGVAKPDIDESMDLLIRTKPDAVIAVPHFLFCGILTERIKSKVELYKKEYPWVQFYVSGELGIHENVSRLIDMRIAEAISGKSSLHCDNCKYRHPMPSQEKHLGGLRALLWSIRHNYSHAFESSEKHSHAKIDKHVLVCTNADCASRGSMKVLAALRKALKLKNIRREVAITRTSCLGHCTEGPTVVVYPDGIWYKGVNEADVDEIVEGHIEKDVLIDRLVDTIM